MNNELNWLSLSEYSSKYKVSVSTLRRRIKMDNVKFQFSDGKYLIIDEPLIMNSKMTLRPSQVNALDFQDEQSSDSFKGSVQNESMNPIIEKEELEFSAANRVLNELKKAYMSILQEKEEQIMLLKDESADLRTLVRVLESEVQRLSDKLYS